MRRDFPDNEELARPLTERAAGVGFSAAVVGVLVASLLFMAIIKGFGIAEQSDIYLLLGFLMPCIALAAAIVVTVMTEKLEFSSVFGLFNFKIKSKYYLVAVLTVGGTLLALGRVNEVFINLLKNFGYQEPQTTLPAFSAVWFILTILAVAILPPVLEETVFRGLMLSGLKDWGVSKIIVVAACFALYHMSPAKTAYQFVVGVLFCLIAVKSGSVVPTVIAHILNNLLVILNYYFGIFAVVDVYPVIFTVLGGIMLVAAVVILVFDKKKMKSGKKDLWGFFATAGMGIVCALVVWVAGL